MPPEPTAATSNDLAASDMKVIIAGGTCTTDNPLALKAGEVTVILDVQDQDKSLYALLLFNLDEGKNFLDLMAATARAQPSWANDLLFETLESGKSDTYTFWIEQGPVYLVCFSKPPDIAIGNAGPFTVVP